MGAGDPGPSVGQVGAGRSSGSGILGVAIDYLDLATTTSATGWMKVPRGANKLAVQIVLASAKSWSTAVIQPQWAIMGTDSEHEIATTFKPSVIFDVNTPSHPSISVSGKSWVRLKVTTAATGADPAIKTIMSLT